MRPTVRLGLLAHDECKTSATRARVVHDTSVLYYLTQYLHRLLIALSLLAFKRCKQPCASWRLLLCESLQQLSLLDHVIGNMINFCSLHETTEFRLILVLLKRLLARYVSSSPDSLQCCSSCYIYYAPERWIAVLLLY